MKNRLRKELLLLIIIVSAGIAYYLLVKLSGRGIPCVFNLITGLKCPACGITRMLFAMMRLDFAAAFRHNPVIFVTLPVIAGCIVCESVMYIKTGVRKLPKAVNLILWLEIIILIIYGVIRNIG